MNLLSAEFPKDLEEVEQANIQIKTINKKIKNSIEVLDNYKDRVDDIVTLVALLDKLLELAIKFI